VWVKLDDHFPDHRKLAELGDYAPLCGWLYVCGLAFCNRQLTDGRIPKAHIHRLTSFRHVSIETASIGPKDAPYGTCGEDVTVESLAERLVLVCLWEDDGDAYRIHDYSEYQPTRAAIEAVDRARREGGRKGAEARWHRPAGDNSTHRSTDGSTTSKTMAQRCPVPVPGTDPEEERTPPSPPSGGTVTAPTPDGFSRFWAAYPRKIGKGAAEKAWRKLRPSATLVDLMLEALCRQCASPEWRREHGIYIPYPQKWLNEARWDDEAFVDPVHDPPSVCRHCGATPACRPYEVAACLARQKARASATVKAGTEEAPPYEARTGRG